MTDKIAISLKKEPQLEAMVSKNKSYILSETLADNLTFDPNLSDGLTLEFEKIKTILIIKKISS